MWRCRRAGLFCGSTRYLSLATSAFFGIGAYTSALALEKFGGSSPSRGRRPVATVVAVVMGAAVLHLRGTYFVVLTFGMTELDPPRHHLLGNRSGHGHGGPGAGGGAERDTIYLTVLAGCWHGGAVHRRGAPASAWR